MDRKLYKLPFKKDNIPDWTCPTCGKGFLRIKNGTFFREESYDSRNEHKHQEWDPEWIRFVYSCLLKCSNDKCEDIVSNTGTGFVEWVHYDRTGVDGSPNEAYDEYFIPTFFQPHLKLINIPDKTPEDVTNALYESFKVFFSSPSSASNHIRVSIEYLLTELNVKRYELIDGKRRTITLHNRINNLPKKYKDYKELFFAIKWLGNAGSHGGRKLTSDDVMDDYEIMEHLLEELYVKKTDKLKKIAKKINKNKGPKNSNKRTLPF